MTVVVRMSVGRSRSRTSPCGAVVDRVGRHAAAVRSHPGHHHHVVGDGLHHRQRAGARVVRARRHAAPARSASGRCRSRRAGSRRPPARSTRLRARAPSPARSSREENSTVAPPAPSTLRKVRRPVPSAAGLADRVGPHIRHPPACRRGGRFWLPAVGGPRRGPGEPGALVGAVADDEPVHLGPRRGDVEDREAVVVEVEVLDVPVVGLDRRLDGDARGPRRACR